MIGTSAGKCEACYTPSYTLQNGKCYKTLDFCGVYNTNGTCKACEQNSTFKGGNCVPCASGDTWYQGKCYPKIANCTSQQGDTCKTCERGYAPGGGKCTPAA